MKSFQMLILTLACFFCVAATSVTNSVIGVWRSVKTESSDPAYQHPTGELEMQFTADGAITVKLRDPAHGAATTQTIEGKFTLIPPDRVTFTFNGTTQDRYRYSFVAGELRMEHLDFPVTNTLKRLEKFSL
jgi:hypothetical protein